MSDRSPVKYLSEEDAKVLATYFGDDKVKVDWKDEFEKSLFWFYDDLHCPNPISPLYFDVGGWWGPPCEYMYRRFGAPIGSEWIGKKIGGYVYTAVVPPRTDPDKVQGLFDYYTKVMPIYADTFYDRWINSYVPELKAAGNYIVNYSRENKGIPELLIHMEDCLDLQERALRIHWIINLAQFQASTEFTNMCKEIFGEVDNDLIGKINVSRQDKNWDSLKALWEIKQYICSVPDLKTLFIESPVENIIAKVGKIQGGDKLLKMIADYQEEYGYKAVYTHEYIYKTWKEDPTPIFEALRGYIINDYDYYKDYNTCIQTQEAAIKELYSRTKNARELEKLKKSLELCIKMAPLTPDHHFYIDQGIYARMRIMFLNIGKAYVNAGILNDPEDIFMLEYNEIRCAGVSNYPVKELVKKRREEMETAKAIKPREWYGTATVWSVYKEPYKTLWGYPQKFEAEMAEKANKAYIIDEKVIKGIPGSPGVAEGVARFVESPAQFDEIQNGEVLVCKMTNPAWVICFPKISALVTDTGGALSHPAVVSREFGIPCVVGTRRATQLIKTGMRVRVDGNTGTVEVIG
ncbi:PEP-utilizing enzyme [Tepidanaerobacter syntrophicus]|uniref:PEP-utilizing enzyme n=1 Tax=Tepidanaerobacter syntrophicus TaxID=224999 RepID=UPI001BD6705D|nr:PEP-utilizing enzyme [Tepidanaerobacter syntrophicus]